jgi:hypothetical protein
MVGILLGTPHSTQRATQLENTIASQTRNTRNHTAYPQIKSHTKSYTPTTTNAHTRMQCLCERSFLFTT